MSVFEWYDRGDSIDVDHRPGGGLWLIVDNDGQRASIVLPYEVAGELVSKLDDELDDGLGSRVRELEETLAVTEAERDDAYGQVVKLEETLAVIEAERDDAYGQVVKLEHRVRALEANRDTVASLADEGVRP